MKPGLEGRHQRDLRQFLAQQPHGRDVGRIVRRGDGAHLLHGRQHVGRHALHSADAAGMHRFEADGGNLAGVLQAARVRVGQLGQRLPNRRSVIRDVRRQLAPRAADLDETAALAAADPLDAAARIWRSSAMSNSRYLKLVEPRLATRIFMSTATRILCGEP